MSDNLDLFNVFADDDAEKLRAAGYSPSPGRPGWWVVPDNKGVVSEAEALRQLARGDA